MRRWKLFLRNSVIVLSDLRRLLIEFHVLIAMLMLIALAAIEFWHVVSRMMH
jgi:hypothetical protein